MCETARSAEPPDASATFTRSDYDALVSPQTVPTTDIATLVQFGSSTCAKCPPFTARVRELAAEYAFQWIYIDAHRSDLPTYLSIRGFPAFALVRRRADASMETTVLERATADTLRATVVRMCERVLRLDEDF